MGVWRLAPDIFLIYLFQFRGAFELVLARKRPAAVIGLRTIISEGISWVQ